MGPGGQDLDYLAGDWLYRLSLRSICIMYTYVLSTSPNIIRVGGRPKNLVGGRSVLSKSFDGTVFASNLVKIWGLGASVPSLPLGSTCPDYLHLESHSSTLRM